jgi:hypothetical protein
VTSGALLCDVEFLPPGLNALADEMVARIEAGFPPQCSVGFLATETPTRNTAGGTAYRGQSLLELSLVNIPANADARLVPQMRAADPAPIVQWLVAKGVAPFPRAPLRLAKGEIRLGPAPTLAGTAPGEVRIGGGTSAVALAQAFPSITRLLRPPTMKSNPLDLPPGISERDVRRMVVDGVKIALAQAVRRLRADY